MADMGTLQTLEDMNATVANSHEDVRGHTVFDRNANELGKVDALLADEQLGHVRFLRVASGGILGIGENTFLLPVDVIEKVTDQAVYIDRTHEHVSGAPAYDPDLEMEQDQYESIYRHFDLTPYWALGRIGPTFPYMTA